MDIDGALRKRRSIRRYQRDRKIPKTLIRQIIEAGCLAPSLHNLQPWEFIVLNKDRKRKVAGIMRKRARSEIVFLNNALRENASFVEEAPLAMAVYNTRPLSLRFKRLGGFYESRCIKWEVQSIACCIENMLLKATSLGIGSALIGISLLCDRDINRLLRPKSELMAILTFGYPDERPKERKIKDLSEVARFL